MKSCPHCGAPVADTEPTCPNCKQPLGWVTPPPPNAQPGYYPQAADNGMRNIPTWALFAISFVVPIAGIVLGILYYVHEPMKDPVRGKWCLIGVFAPIIVGCCIFGMFGLLVPITMSR